MAVTNKTIVTENRVIKLYDILYRCESETVKGKFYTVIVKKDDGPSSCTCPAFQYGNRILCKHMRRVMESIEYENFVDATEQKEKLTDVKSWRDDEYDF